VEGKCLIDSENALLRSDCSLIKQLKINVFSEERVLSPHSAHSIRRTSIPSDIMKANFHLYYFWRLVTLGTDRTKNAAMNSELQTGAERVSRGAKAESKGAGGREEWGMEDSGKINSCSYFRLPLRNLASAALSAARLSVCSLCSRFTRLA